MSSASAIDALKQRLADSQKRTFPYEMREFGLDLTVHAGVFPPSHFLSWRWSIENFPSVAGERVLEIGCGMGLPSIYLAKNGAISIVAVDIDPRAVENTRENASRNGVDNMTVLESDMFCALDKTQTFDTIYWNFPCTYVPSDYEYANDLERGIFDPGYRMLRVFLEQAHAFLTKNGRILLEFGEGERATTLRELAEENGYSIALVARGSLPEGGRIYQFYELKDLSSPAARPATS
jgi:release factor glutamine methyltransferase